MKKIKLTVQQQNKFWRFLFLLSGLISSLISSVFLFKML